MNPYSLEGKLVLVTGAGTGIGQGVALELARQGADVALHYSTSARGASEAVAQITDMGRRAVAIQGDLEVVADCRRVVDEAAAFLGGLDGLVNSAGLTSTIDFLDVTEEQFNRLHNLNMRGQFFCAQQATRHMIGRGQKLRHNSSTPSSSVSPRLPLSVSPQWAGSIVNISSVHAIAGFPGHSVYAGTKGAIVAFSRELAIELIPARIRVNVLAPGSIEVPSYFRADPTYTREIGNTMVPWGRVGLPADVGYAVAYLLSDASEFMTGQVIYLDGGLTAKMALPYEPVKGER